MSKELFDSTQHFQQAIATTITCRSIIKYSSTLNDEQKNEVLTEIEHTLAFLSTRLAANVGSEAEVVSSPEKVIDLGTTQAEDGQLREAAYPGPDSQAVVLKNLHQLYQIYLCREPGKGLAALETRYKTVMELLDHIQMHISENDERLLHRIRGLISAIYGIFREFALLLSNIIEGKAIDMDTEALASPSPDAREVEKQPLARDMTPLLQVYRMHLQVQARKGTLTACARDATAFLVFLAECLGQSFSRRAELITQIKSITSLLNEQARLLAAYEQAIATFNAP